MEGRILAVLLHLLVLVLVLPPPPPPLVLLLHPLPLPNVDVTVPHVTSFDHPCKVPVIGKAPPPACIGDIVNEQLDILEPGILVIRCPSSALGGRFKVFREEGKAELFCSAAKPLSRVLLFL